MNKANGKYMICDSNKAPMHKWEDYKSLSEVKDCDNVGLLIEEPYLIVDIDDETEFDILCKIIRDKGIHTRILKTSRGGHFWFKSEQPLPNLVHAGTPLTLTIDIKCWGKKSMEIVKKNGEWREWLQEDDTIDVLPAFLKPIQHSKSFYGMDDGDGRNDALFAFIWTLVRFKLAKEEVEETLDLINRYMFATPLEDREIHSILESSSAFDNMGIAFFSGKAFLHDKFADYMINAFNIKYYRGQLYYYDGTVYTCDERMIKAKMVEKIPALKVTHINEAFENIRFKCMLKEEEINKNYVNVRNGLLNLDTLDLMPHTPAIFNVNQLNVEYDPKATNAAVDTLLGNLTLHRQPLINLISQMLGYVLVPDCRYQKSFILLGNGSNGKSVFLEMIRNLFGDNNCSSLSLEDLQEKFRIPELDGKMLNIGDDSGHALFDNTAIFKKIVTGDSITVERKREQPYKFANTAKLMFAANTLPPTTDKSDGFFRRCIIIPFEAVFSPNDKTTYDPLIVTKVTTDSAKSYLLNLALAGLKLLNENQYFDETVETKIAIQQYKESNNSVLVWRMQVSKSFNVDSEAYVNYATWCVASGYKPVNIGKFKTEYDRLKD